MKRFIIERNVYGDFIPVVSEVELNKSDLKSMKELGFIRAIGKFIKRTNERIFLILKL